MFFLYYKGIFRRGITLFTIIFYEAHFVERQSLSIQGALCYLMKLFVAGWRIAIFLFVGFISLSILLLMSLLVEYVCACMCVHLLEKF